MTTQIYTSRAKERREELKAISQPLKALVKSGQFETLNSALIECVYKRDGNQTFRTFEQWKKDGYSIIKGSQSFVVWGSPRELQKPNEEEEEIKEFFPICYLFSNKQVYKRDEANLSTEVQEEAELYKSFHEIEIKYNPERSFKMPTVIRGSKDVYNALIPLYSEFIAYREAFAVLFTNQANHVVGFSVVSYGGITGTIADPRMIFQLALKSNACGLFLCHNHPSGSLKPSQADLDLTEKLKNGAFFLDMRVLDHLIITDTGYFSFADEGLM